MYAIMALHSFFYYLFYYVLLGKIVEWFPLALSMVWNSDFSFLEWFPLKAKRAQSTLPFYLIAERREEFGRIDGFMPPLCVKLNAIG